MHDPALLHGQSEGTRAVQRFKKTLTLLLHNLPESIATIVLTLLRRNKATVVVSPLRLVKQSNSA